MYIEGLQSADVIDVSVSEHVRSKTGGHIPPPTELPFCGCDGEDVEVVLSEHLASVQRSLVTCSLAAP